MEGSVGHSPGVYALPRRRKLKKQINQGFNPVPKGYRFIPSCPFTRTQQYTNHESTNPSIHQVSPAALEPNRTESNPKNFISVLPMTNQLRNQMQNS
jgi:hypothetical protein